MAQSTSDATQVHPIYLAPSLSSQTPLHTHIPDSIDSYIIYDFIPPETSDALFYELLNNEIKWGTMYHHGGPVPRLVCIQSQLDDAGWTPLYRHPTDPDTSSLTVVPQFSKSVNFIRNHIQLQVKHPVNHVLIQLYRNGEDYISEHADKTVDIVPGSKIVNFSLGAERRMVLREKKGRRMNSASKASPVSRTSQQVGLKHGSVLVMGLCTNRFWTHGIKPDKGPLAQKTAEQKKFDGVRISLTFRHIGTFVYPDIHRPLRIYGVGASRKNRDNPASVVPVYQENEVGWAQAVALLNAFADENRLAAEFDWNTSYGNGYDVVALPAAIKERT
ncbi:uncharacterized protein V1513DRAFT_379624 [Lipomyces chichibuensis]|uniref:uncharacterized protein n=1 Tax=Lipomyces chichibuensis TaxID=1546026 RepID=UPI0033436BDA